ncbi:hypothetical protein F2P44_30350 [Massilia sp. CCM 8695]|uniref:3-oxoacyl-ACP synthase n=1 Tax=Massilia frigida TaxID=2609281 RepID=A0ABX0NDK2_9BURK|nr:hypothetical protein [Massilia frigida]NHZ83536.1 hypothetical protein [Massilia frigida]
MSDHLGWAPLVVKSSGLCCAVGFSLAAASCALRARIDHFKESMFVDGSGKPLLVAQLPLDDQWGPERLAELIQYAIADCNDAQDPIDADHTALLLLAPERGRPHSGTEQYNSLYRKVEEQFGASFQAGSAVFPQGRAAIGDALIHAQNLLRAGGVKHVLVVGADCLLDVHTIRYFLNQDRILCPANSDGFIPGEAAAALLLSLGDGDSTGLHITGAGAETEEALIDGVIPNRAVGLTKAIRTALGSAGVKPSALAFRMSDQNGEQFYVKEAANAFARIMLKDGVGVPVLHIADSIGETGAAAATATLAYLGSLAGMRDEPGDCGLVHFASDNGRRSAIVVDYR